MCRQESEGFFLRALQIIPNSASCHGNLGEPLQLYLCPAQTTRHTRHSKPKRIVVGVDGKKNYYRIIWGEKNPACSGVCQLKTEQDWSLCLSLNSILCLSSAVLYHRWGKLELAKKHYELSLKLDPEAPGTRDNYNMLRRKLDQLKLHTP